MGSTNKAQEFAYRVINVYENKAKRSMPKTMCYFKGKAKCTIYRIIKRYLKEGRVTFVKNSGVATANKHATPEKLKKLKELLELDPGMSNFDIGNILGIEHPRPVAMLRKRLSDMGFKTSWHKSEGEAEGEGAADQAQESTGGPNPSEPEPPVPSAGAEQEIPEAEGLVKQDKGPLPEPQEAAPSSSNSGAKMFFDNLFGGNQNEGWDEGMDETFEDHHQGYPEMPAEFEPTAASSSSFSKKHGQQEPKIRKKKKSHKQEVNKKPRESDLNTVISLPCLFCDKPVKVTMGPKASTASGENNENSLVEENMKTIFILKHLLDLTSSEIRGLMEEAEGKDPKDWIRICKDCFDKFLQEALNIRKEIQNLELKLMECKTKIETEIRNVVRSKPNRRRRTKKLDITSMVRGMVSDKDVGGLGKRPKTLIFARGDELAAELAQKLAEFNASKVEVKMEPQSDVEFDGSEFEGAAPFNDYSNDGDDGGEMEIDDNDNGNADPVSDYDSPEPEPDSDDDYQEDSDECDKNFFPGQKFVYKRFRKKKNKPEEKPKRQYDKERRKQPLDWDPSKVAMVENLSEHEKQIAEAYRYITDIPETVTCEVCEEEMRPVTLPMHKLRKHKIVMAGYSVKKCTHPSCTYFTLYDDLHQLHLKRHDQDGPMPFSCQFCGKGFRKHHNLRVHEETHKNAATKPFQCDICGNSFALKRYLATHKTQFHLRKLPPAAVKRLSKATKERLAIPDPVEQVFTLEHVTPPAPVPAPASTDQGTTQNIIN